MTVKERCVSPENWQSYPQKGQMETEYMRLTAKHEFTAAFPVLSRLYILDLAIQTDDPGHAKYLLLARTELAMGSLGIKLNQPEYRSPFGRLFGIACESGDDETLLETVETLYQELAWEKQRQTRHRKEDPDAVLRFLDTCYDDPALDTAMVSKACGVSRGYVSRVVNQYSGRSFPDYVNMLRVNASKDLLEYTDLSMNEICQRVGYSSRCTLYRAFKKLVGMAPQEYRMHHQSGQSA